MSKLLTRCLSQISRHWPALLLLGLVTLEVLGACGSMQLLRRAHHTRPLTVRYRIRRDHILYIFGLGRDTTAVELRYQGQELRPPRECTMPASGGLASYSYARRLAGSEPRWLLSTDCVEGTAVYLLRVPASGPAFYRIGPVRRSYYRSRAGLAMPPLDQGQTSFLADNDTTGWLFNWQTLRSEAVRLPELGAVRWQPWSRQVAYTASPDQRVLARVYRPGTDDFPSQPLPRLIIDQYDLDRRSAHRLTFDGVSKTASPLQLTQWTQVEGRWQLMLRP